MALLAVLSAGGVYLPLDTAAPAEHRRDVLTDSGARVELRDGPQPGAEPPLTGRVDPPRAGVEPTDADTAYLLYTSGTTGRPKGVCVTRGALAAHVDDMAERLELVPEDRVLWFAAPHVDVAWEQALTPLRVGATVVTRGPGVPTFGELADLVERHVVTVANLPGGYWNAWALALTEQQRTQCRALRLMISGSERMSARAAVNWQRILPDVPLLNACGPTEAVITSTLFRVPAGLAARDEIPIGTVCGSRQGRVLGAELSPVARGQVGELHIGGGPLAREYLGRPSMTAARFVPDPYADSRGAVMYRTGDLVRENADGDLEFVGRVDDQVKARGFRVEPAEVRLAHGHRTRRAARARGGVRGGLDGRRQPRRDGVRGARPTPARPHSEPTPGPRLGPHYCIGAPLARVELAALFGVLSEAAERVEVLRPPVPNRSLINFGLDSLDVRLHPRAGRG